MKVYIGPYRNWFGPYQLAELLCFWVKEVPGEYGIRSKPDWVHDFGDFLAHGFHRKQENDNRMFKRNRHETWLYKLLTWIHSKQKRKMDIRIDHYDSWNMDSTLSPIILPLLKQLKATKHGSGMINLEDVPVELRYTTTEEYEGQKTFDFYHEDKQDDDAGPNIHTRYEWVLDEMIWAFEQMQPDCDWEEQYSTGEIDFITEVSDTDANGKPRLYQLKEGPDHTRETDWEAMQKHQDRISNGLRLFGKYYQTLWD